MSNYYYNYSVSFNNNNLTPLSCEDVCEVIDIAPMVDAMTFTCVYSGRTTTQTIASRPTESASTAIPFNDPIFTTGLVLKQKQKAAEEKKKQKKRGLLYRLKRKLV